MEYNYLDGLWVLHYLNMSISLSQIKDFREQFEYHYQDMKKHLNEIRLPVLFFITKKAYCDVISCKDKSLEAKLDEEFLSKIKSIPSFFKKFKDDFENYSQKGKTIMIAIRDYKLN